MGAHAAENNVNALKQPGLFIVFPSFRPVKTHRPAHKRPLTTIGDFSFQPRLGTITHPPTMAQTPDPFVLSATCVMQHSAPVCLRMWCEPGNPIPNSCELQGVILKLNTTCMLIRTRELRVSQHTKYKVMTLFKLIFFVIQQQQQHCFTL